MRFPIPIDFTDYLIVPTSSKVSAPGRALDTTFQPSATRPVLITEGVRIATSGTITLLGGTTQSGRVNLLSDTASPPTTVIDTLEGASGLTGTVLVGITVTSSAVDAKGLMGLILPGHNVFIDTINVTGTPTFTKLFDREVIL